ncbi:hypothetical protein B0H17DRAFT_1145638 [Mycena rosella]|uniref:F-box domain-containing protein n=1 Tax=Mycena rosella TaxID=1033263 RepID=A0AAD7G5N5_MYCRO|nr:hypothetical protein B0H17DRAFT_1145638 [Mycena rosella]
MNLFQYSLQSKLLPLAQYDNSVRHDRSRQCTPEGSAQKLRGRARDRSHQGLTLSLPLSSSHYPLPAADSLTLLELELQSGQYSTGPSYLTMAHYEMDTELLQNHQAKTAIRLVETEGFLRDIETNIATAARRVGALERHILTLEARKFLCSFCPDGARPDGFGPAARTGPSRASSAPYPNHGRGIPCIPIRRIPTDVLVFIFTTAKPKEIEFLGRGAAPLLSYVCAEWRAVACDHAALWASFAFSMFDQNSAVVTCLQTYLRGSKAALLKIELDAPHHFRHSVSQMRALKAIAEHSKRIYSLSLIGPNWRSVPLRGFYNGLLRLEILHLADLASCSSQEFAIAARLHTLILKDSRVSGNHPLSQIRSLHLHNGASPTGLTNFKNLESLTCTLIEVAYQDPSRSPPLLNPLNSMCSFSDLDASCKTSFSGSPRFASRRSYKFSESSPGLESFAMEAAGPTPATIPDRLLEALTIATERQPLLPKLTHFLIDGKYMFHDTVLIEMLESRTGHSNHLQVDLVLVDRVVTYEIVERLKTSQGLIFRWNAWMVMWI